MCESLYHLMNLEELLDTLHPDAKRAIVVQIQRYERERDEMWEELDAALDRAHELDEEISDLKNRSDEQDVLITELYKEIEDLEQGIDN